jgi:3-deoxy-D-manno-octulosonate 8-phosphate phosphatase (KDO 8-P phosphatase)
VSLRRAALGKGALLERAARVKLALFDVDGVLTDGRLFLGDDGQELKCFHTRDGQGLTMLRDAGIEIGIISGRSSKAVGKRMAELGIELVYQGRLDKLAVLQTILDKRRLGASEVAYVGDDLPDLPVMLRVGLAVAVADAHELVQKHAHYGATRPGGQGAVREVCELILEARGMLARINAGYLA